MKLHKYGFNKDALKTIHSYLKNRYKRTKIDKVFSSWSKILLGVPHGSAAGPLLFNIYLNNLIYLAEKTDICNFTDNTTFHACDSRLDYLVKILEHDVNLAIVQLTVITRNWTKIMSSHDFWS